MRHLVQEMDDFISSSGCIKVSGTQSPLVKPRRAEPWRGLVHGNVPVRQGFADFGVGIKQVVPDQLFCLAGSMPGPL